jgi:hypothetical protein
MKKLFLAGILSAIAAFVLNLGGLRRRVTSDRP